MPNNQKLSNIPGNVIPSTPSSPGTPAVNAYPGTPPQTPFTVPARPGAYVSGISAPTHRPHVIPVQEGQPEPIRPRTLSDAVEYPNDLVARGSTPLVSDAAVDARLDRLKAEGLATGANTDLHADPGSNSEKDDKKDTSDNK